MKSATGSIAGAALAGVLAAAPALAETQTETIVAEQRTSISLRVSPAAAQAFLPAGWTPNASAEGPNLTLVFMDRKLALTPDGKPLQSGVNRVLVLVIPAKSLATGETRSMIVGGYSADPLGVPGAYKVYAPGALTITRTERSDLVAMTTTVEEHWAAKGADGATVALDLAFTRGVPNLASFEQKNYSGAEPDFYRIYRGQQASEVLRGGAVDHVQSVTLKVSGGKLGAAINGTEKIVSISSAPFYSRKTYLP
ncbi:hypothetical protein BH11PSE2_BH11PSE2_12460 [soil metagenome]